MKFWDYTRFDRDKIGHMGQVAGTRRYEFADGKAKGVEAVELHTGAGLELTVLPGRGMDIAWVNYRGVPLSYLSKTGITGPAYYESDGMKWLHTFFAGALTTCGLLHVGGPETVTHPVVGEREYGIHGRISNCTAEQVSVYEDWENDEYVMKVSGVMSEGVLHGESLTLRREIATKFGSKEFTIRDVITNRATLPQPIMLLYHINFGYPLLNGGARFVANTLGCDVGSDEARQDFDKRFECEEPIQSLAERLYFHDMAADENGNVKLALVNDELELGVALEYNKNELPKFNQWKMLSKKEYVMGLEPGTSLPIGYAQAKERGMLQTLQPDEQKTVSITYKILDGKDEIAAYEKSIKG